VLAHPRLDVEERTAVPDRVERQQRQRQQGEERDREDRGHRIDQMLAGQVTWRDGRGRLAIDSETRIRTDRRQGREILLHWFPSELPETGPAVRNASPCISGTASTVFAPVPDTARRANRSRRC